METFQIPGIFANNICRAKKIGINHYQIFRDTIVIGSVIRENGGWQMEDYKSENLTAENVQLIGQQIDKRNS